jgi:bifunctional ADP-heptose synthase (sugar kinase/adenylyltransferase)
MPHRYGGGIAKRLFFAIGGEVLVLNFEDGCSTTNIIKKIQKDSEK